jgi:AcrR family transcriptional regulator
MVANPEAPLTQAERKALSDQCMLDAAVRLIVERGPEKTTLKALGEAAGYSRGLVTYRFGSKAGLFKAVIKRVSERFSQEVEKAVASSTGIDAVLAAAESYYRFVLSSPKDIRAMQILFHSAAEPGSSLTDVVSRVQVKQRSQVATWVAAGQRDGAINGDICAETFAARFCAYTLGMTFYWMLDSCSIQWEQAHQDFKLSIQQQLAA